MTKQDNGQRNWRVRMLLLHGTMVIAPVALLLIQDHLHVNTLGLCIFKEMFGVDCPACGITHSVMALLSGRVHDAFCTHPAGPIIFGVVCLLTAYLCLVLFTGHKVVEWRKEATQGPRALCGLLAR